MKDFKLDDHPKIKSGFTPPESYFDGFNEKIQHRLHAKKAKLVRLHLSTKRMIGIAAILVVGLMITFTFRYGQQSQDQKIEFAALENYITYQSGISQYDLVSLLDESDLEKIDQDLGIEDKTIEDILVTDSNLENYITD